MPRCPNPRCQANYPAGTKQCTNPLCQCLLPEALVAGRYRIETLIGIGGMGAVYRASDTFEMSQVALKLLTLINSPMDLETAVERFRREARYTHQLKHENIVPVLNFGQDGELLYLAMPLVTGGTLKALLKAERPLPTAQAQRYLNDLADAIDACHNHPQQIIHRDIKPSNLLIHQDDGRLVVTDFGIARVEREKAITLRGWSLGTEHYIAPEQEHGNPQPASDIYAMGVVAYQMFSGLLPFQAVVKVHTAELPGPSALNLALPHEIDPVILRAIDIDPEKRYKTAREFADAVNKVLAGEDVWSAPTISVTATATSSANIVVRILIPDNPCSHCGRENRTTSHYCRHCGHSLNDTSPLVTEVCQVGYVSEIGQKARDNEDMLLIVQGLCVTLMPPRPFSLFAVADGLLGLPGKGAGGHEASSLAIDTLSDVLLPQLTYTATPTTMGTPDQSQQSRALRLKQPKQPVETLLVDWMQDAVRQANQVIYHCNADYDTSMASTLTAALLYKRHLVIASVGDSRAYHYNATRGLQRITTDHTLAANLVEANLLQPEEIYQSARRNSHYHYLGQQHHVHADLFHREVVANDLILLCTDGLWHRVHDERIQEILKQGGDPQILSHMLTEEANDAGGEGNISAIVMCVQ